VTIPFTNVSSSATIGTSERSLPADTTSGVPTSQTTFCSVIVTLDLSAMLAGDTFNLVVYEKVAGGTQRALATFPLVGAYDSLLVLPPLSLGEGWDITLKKIAGTDRAIRWSLREDVGNRNVSSIDANAITATAINASALTGAKFANDVNVHVIRTATAQAGSVSSITLDASASALDNIYYKQLVHIVSGTGAGQSNIILDYAGSTKVCTTAVWPQAPDSTSVFQILPDHDIPYNTQAALVTSIASASSAALLDDSYIEGNITVGQGLRGLVRTAFGAKRSGDDANVSVIRDIADTKNSHTVHTASTGITSVTIHDLDE
jgi:hypothetical protein